MLVSCDLGFESGGVTLALLSGIKTFHILWYNFGHSEQVVNGGSVLFDDVIRSTMHYCV